MMRKIFLNIKKIIFIIIVGFFLSLLLRDYNNFNNREEFVCKISDAINENYINVDIVGNYFMPKDVVAKIINNNDYDNRYDLLIEDLKIITLSNKDKLIIIKEDNPLFYDKNYIYLSSRNQIEADLNIIGKKELPIIELDILYDNKRTYSQSINKIRNFINYLRNHYNDLYNNLEKVTYNSIRGDNSPHLSLSIFIAGCQIVLSDESGTSVSLDQKEFEYKIDVLSEALKQYPKKIDEISEIDLRYSDFYGIFFN